MADSKFKEGLRRDVTMVFDSLQQKMDVVGSKLKPVPPRTVGPYRVLLNSEMRQMVKKEAQEITAKLRALLDRSGVVQTLKDFDSQLSTFGSIK